MSKRKLPGNAGGTDPTGGCPNQDFVEMLYELANHEKNVNRNTFKSSAYRKAAGVLAGLDYRIKSGDEARKLSGIGDKIAKKIDEMLQTGKLEKLEKIRADDSNSIINLFTRVAGIGPAKARDLAEAGFTSIEDLRARVLQDQEQGKTEHHSLFTRAQLIGLKHFEDFERRIPRDEIARIESFVTSKLKKLKPAGFEATVCGSYRRGLPSSGDVDFLITHPDYTSASKKAPGTGSKGTGAEGAAAVGGNLLRKVVSALEDSGLITDTISMGDSKFMGVCRLDGAGHFRRLDIRILPADQFFCGVLYFTGSDEFNKRMRAHALEEGFTLNEYTLRPLDQGHQPLEPLPIICEEDIFDYISFHYRAPQERSW